jgi:hypothetical protein
MGLNPLYYLVDNNGQQWAVGVTNSAILQAIPVSGQAAVPYVYVNSVTDGSSWAISIITTAAGTQYQTTSVTQGSYPTQLPVTAPNGVTYGVQVANLGPPILGQPDNGILQTAFLIESYNCNTPLSALAQNVLNRLEDPTGIFWSQSFEIMSALAEAENLLMLLVGRPTQTVTVPFNLVPNTVWQTTPAGVMLITDIYGPQSLLRKASLWDMDFSMSSWGPDWEQDVSTSGPVRFGNLGFTKFFVHPAPAQPQTVLIDAIQYPVPVSGFPYSGATTIPFHEEIFVALEDYACVYNRVKEAGAELQEAMPLYKSFLELAKRLSTIEDRRDNMIWSMAFGPQAGANSAVQR